MVLAVSERNSTYTAPMGVLTWATGVKLAPDSLLCSWVGSRTAGSLPVMSSNLVSWCSGSLSGGSPFSRDDQNPGSFSWLDTQFSGLVAELWTKIVLAVVCSSEVELGEGERVTKENTMFCFLSAISL